MWILDYTMLQLIFMSNDEAVQLAQDIMDLESMVQSEWSSN
jgi:hypothetical protein